MKIYAIIILLMLSRHLTQGQVNIINNWDLENCSFPTAVWEFPKDGTINSNNETPHWGNPVKKGSVLNPSNWPIGEVAKNIKYQGEHAVRLSYYYKERTLLRDKDERSYAINKLPYLNPNHVYEYTFIYKLGNSENYFDANKVGIVFSTDQPSIEQIKKGSTLSDWGFMDDFYVVHSESLYLGSGWYKTTRKFETPSMFSYQYATFGHYAKYNAIDGGDYLYIENFELIDLGPIEDQCNTHKLISNANHITSHVYDAEISLRSGYGVGGPNGPGDVYVSSGQHVVYKAGSEVIMEPGFQTLPNTNFIAYIAPCGEDPCEEELPHQPDSSFKDCGGVPFTIYSGYPQGNLGSISWIPSNYLDNPHSANPTFYPPSGSGVMTYSVVYGNPCGVGTFCTIDVTYGQNQVIPVISMGNLVQDEYELSFDLAMQTESEWLEIYIIDKGTGYIVATTGLLQPGVDYTTTYHYEAPLYSYTSVCSDYEVHIKTKNTCTPDIVYQTEEWNRSSYCSPKPQLISTPTSFSPDGDGVEEEYCINVCGADYYDVVIKENVSGSAVFSASSVAITSNNICLWDGGTEMAGNYDINITLYACGQAYVQTPYTISLVR
ncbi:MAG: hypothetical protein KDC83_14050 [Flavobacteriales bacterium]|nr:hypothetical protein [Flavobacteriales bacterium]